MKKLGYIVLVITALWLMVKPSEKEEVIPNESIRFRVIANSNLPTDQYVKTKVKDQLEETLGNILENAKNIEDVRFLLQYNLPLLDNVVKTTLLSLNENEEDYSIDYGYHLFPEKMYKDHVYQEDYYESLVVTLGKGKGDNWWCVLFPPLCFMEEEYGGGDVEYASFFKMIFDQLFSK